MAAYFVALLDVHDREEYQRYLDGAGAVLARHRGRALAVEEQPIALEGEWPAGRTVVIEFPTIEDLQRWHESPEYREIVGHRHAAATGSAVAIRGRE